MLTSKKGRLSSADRDRIHSLSERGFSIQEIAEEVERREDVVEGVLGETKAVRVRKGSALARSGAKARDESPPGLLSHFFWVRPGFQIEFNLPADLTEGEAERLCAMVKSLPFS
jgi:hypothetical protein